MSTNSKTGVWFLASIAGLAFAASWAVQGTGAGPGVHLDEEGGGSVSRVHGAIKVPAGDHAGALKTVNGSVTVGDDARVERIKVVNGSVSIGRNAVIRDSAESVNGSIGLGEGSRGKGDLSTVNGRIDLARGAAVDGSVSTVNGRLALHGAEVGSLTTTNGDIELTDGAVVRGDVTVKKSDSKGWSLFGGNRPRVTIGDDCKVLGKLHFEQEVELVVAESASIGPVSGMEPVRP